jgi:hypothetical protein
MRFSGEFNDAKGGMAGYDFKCDSMADAVEIMKEEALMQAGRLQTDSGRWISVPKGKAMPELGQVTFMMLYCKDDDGGWEPIEVPE